MQPEFWHARWEQNQIGFHQAETNPHLQQFWPTLGVEPRARVFVPLCGKSGDMLWLREQGHTVIGVELSRLAVDAFFSENALPCSVESQGAFRIYRADGLVIYCGDFFAMASSDLAGVAAVFDRASLVALPPEMRPGYAAHMRRLLAPGARTLLVAFEYSQQEMAGPPFSVPEYEVRALYEPDFTVHMLHSVDLLEREPRFRERGVSRMEEKVYALAYNSHF